MDAFDSIVGYEEEKDGLRRIADVLRNPGRYRELGVRPPRALLLHGKPGVGKTLMARCLIEASGRRAYVCRKDAPDGAFVEVIKLVFKEAVEHAPSIVFLDDLDKFANEDEGRRDAEEYVTVQSCIDELGDADVFVLATANGTRRFPHSLLRQGRLGNRIRVEVPTERDAREIIEHYLSSKHRVADADAEFLARLLDGNSCATLEEVVNEAGLLAGYRRSDVISEDDLVRATLSLVHSVRIPPCGASSSDEAADLPDGRRHQVAYHEAGHVVAGEALVPGSMVYATTLEGDGGSSGFTKFSRSWRSGTPDDFARAEAEVIRLLAGKTAVEHCLGAVDVGCSSDLDAAFRVVSALVTDDCAHGLDLHVDAWRKDSESLLSGVERAVAAEVERFQRKAVELVVRNEGLLDAVAGALLERQVVTMRDFEALARERPVVPIVLPTAPGFRKPETRC